jgi:NADPH2:quinone reductase
MAYSADPQTYQTAADAVLEMMRLGVAGAVGRSYALDDVASAHTDLESGHSTGSLLLIP